MNYKGLLQNQKIVKIFVTTGYGNAPRNFKTLVNKDFESIVYTPPTLFALAKTTNMHYFIVDLLFKKLLNLII